jgi:hypothetical protein
MSQIRNEYKIESSKIDAVTWPSPVRFAEGCSGHLREHFVWPITIQSMATICRELFDVRVKSQNCLSETSQISQRFSISGSDSCALARRKLAYCSFGQHHPRESPIFGTRASRFTRDCVRESRKSPGSCRTPSILRM